MLGSHTAFCPGNRHLGRTGVFQRAGTTRLVVLAKESRIGRSTIPIPKGVEVTITGQLVKAKVQNRCHAFIMSFTLAACQAARG